MSIEKHEDKIMKKAVGEFPRICAKIFDIDLEGKSIEPYTTELVTIEAKDNSMDYTFLIDDEYFIHFEFQTTKSNVMDDMRRFHFYSAHLQYTTELPVKTYVIYSGGIESAVSEIDCGGYSFKVTHVYMIQKDWDALYEKVTNKLYIGEELLEEELLELIFGPIMTSTRCRRERIERAVKIVSESNCDKKDIIIGLAMVFADKFLEKEEFELVEEVFLMTNMMQNLMDRSEERGIALTLAVMNLLQKGKSDTDISNEVHQPLSKIQAIISQIKNSNC